ncbi:hypothetical protein KZP23_22010 [Echinicola marina]|uniref:hypothetical protein n=1 Tax=Echinicola marina TaxID=2859768 RepID=UPI001CF68D12|nr:hypothetical protein [Echinicola marina]UCS93289.1 hypothetical protein KZP23_22010 [Echinicola marina]
MDKETPIINIFTYDLPYKLANQIYNEYESRLREVKYIIGISQRYKSLEKYQDSVEILLALTIFHKRVIANLDAAVKFYGTVNKYSDSDTIRIGTYQFTAEEKNKLLGLTISYNILRKRFGIPDDFVDYNQTKEFLLKCLSLLNSNYGEN